MVISESNHFIFIRVPKNASTSLATFFVQNYCKGRDDRYTPIGDSGVKTKGISDSLISKHRTQYRFIHLTLQELVEEGVVTRESVKSKEVITVIRDPIERQLSLFFFKHRRNPKDATVEAFRKEYQLGYDQNDGSNSILQSEYCKLDGQFVTTPWLYDFIPEHLAHFSARRKSLPETPLANFKSGIKPERETLIQEYYDKATKKAVEQYFAADFELYHRLKNGY